jgi:DNA-binding transcriptional MerR regulator
MVKAAKNQRSRYYAIGKVAEMTDLPAYTLRYWEQEFKQLSPRKSRTGRRMYSEEDIAQIRQIQDLLHERGYTIKGAREVLEKGERAVRPVVTQKKQDTAPASGPSKREIYLEKKLKTMKRHIRELLEIIKGES